MTSQYKEILLGAKYIKQKKYWLKKLNDIGIVNLFSSPSEEIDAGLESQSFILPNKISYDIKTLCKNNQLSIYILLLSVLKILTSRYLNTNNINVISPLYLPGIGDGNLNKYVHIQNIIDSNKSFKEIILEIKETVINAYGNQDYPVEVIYESLFLNETTTNLVCSLDHIHNDISEVTNDKITFKFCCSENIIDYQIINNSSIYDKNRLKNFGFHFKNLLSNLVNNINSPISKISCLSNQERDKILYSFNNTQYQLPEEKSIIELFKNQVINYPDRIALSFEDTCASYKELDRRAKQYASVIQNETSDPIVGILIEESIDLIIGILGLMYSGKAFVPINHNQSEGRIRTIIKDSNINCILSNKNTPGNIENSNIKYIYIEDISKRNIESDEINVTYNDSLYVIYTSGTTGSPKGVLISHKNVINYNHWFTRTISLSKDDRAVLTTTFAFDAIYTLLFGALLSGARLSIVPRNIYLNPEALINYVDREIVTLLKMTPTLFNVVINDHSFGEKNFTTIRFLMLGGEAINTSDVEKFKEHHQKTKIMNHYGPTETTIGSIATYIDLNKLSEYNRVPYIGKPIDNTAVYILGMNGEILPTGVAGELYIGGTGVGSGYINNQRLTLDKFVQDIELPEEIIYKTGDQAKWLDDGNIEFLGRLDNQVKIRGHRIELGEIEYQLISFPKVDEAMVIDKGEGTDKILIAYYVAKERIGKSKLREYLSKNLNDYMIPSHFVYLEKFPLTFNGKIDKKALPTHKFTTEQDRIPPRNEMELNIAKIWAELFKVEIENIGIHDNFFEIGGDSFKIIKLANLIKSKLQVEISVVDLFTYQRIADLVGFIQSGNIHNISDLESEIDESIEERNEFLKIGDIIN